MKKPLVVPAEVPSARGLQRFLYLTAALCGGAIMIVEILGARMLAPYVGTSLFVWTAQIAVTLVALAAGYYVGGQLADRSGQLSRLYGAILAAALYLCGISLVLRPVVYWCLEFQLALGSLLASALLFFVPLLFLAMTCPFLVRFLTASLSGVGGSVGKLTALSTLGSFLGTLLIGYVLIPRLPNTVTLLLTAGGLFLLAAVYFLRWELPRRPGTMLVVFGLVGSMGAVASWYQDRQPPFAGSRELYRRNSHFGLLQVVESRSGRLRYYLNDYLVQNTYDPESKRGVSAFTYVLHGLARAYTPRIDRVLCIGLGIGLVPAQFAREGTRVDVVEINPASAAVARDYFDCPLDSFGLTLTDGRYFINRSTQTYDAIILDAFLGDSSPSHLMSREAFSEMRRLLGSQGTLVINCFANFHPRRDFFGASLHKTLKAVFRSVRIHSSGSGNVYFVAADRDPLEVLRVPDFASVHPSVRGTVEAAFATQQQAHPDHGLVMTDDYNPVEYFDAANREEIRRGLARYVESL